MSKTLAASRSAAENDASVICPECSKTFEVHSFGTASLNRPHPDEASYEGEQFKGFPGGIDFCYESFHRPDKPTTPDKRKE